MALSRLRDGVRRWGFDIARYPPPDIDAATMATYRSVQAYTMTSLERVAALCAAIRHVSRARVPGAIVECGVWRGGSMMAAARTLLEQHDETRELFLFDTFSGMPTPTSADVRHDGVAAATLHADGWCAAGEADVRANLASTGYPMQRVRLVAGRVEDTIPAMAPPQVAVLRLDTDWYESTRHELEHLYPRLAPGGILVIDDYGWWQGARRAVDEYFADQPVLLHRVDITGRMVVRS